MSLADINSVRAGLAADFEALNDTWLPAAVSIAVVEHGGTLIGPEDPGGPAEYQLELMGVTGFGPCPAAAARQWTLNVARMCDPEPDLEDADADHRDDRNHRRDGRRVPSARGARGRPRGRARAGLPAWPERQVLSRQEAREQADAACRTGPAALALYYGLTVLRRYLRSMIELGCSGASGSLDVNADTPPLPHSLASSARPDVAAALVAIREGEGTLRALRSDLDPRDDDSPAWLDQVIDGEIEI